MDFEEASSSVIGGCIKQMESKDFIMESAIFTCLKRLAVSFY